MDGDEARRRHLREEYEGLQPEERRRRIVLEPAFRDTYNELTEAHRIAVVPQYFWEKWVPVLGPVASMLYMRLRQYCYHNPQTGESRIECWPRQETLAREVGVRDRKTVRRALVLLEEQGFIERKNTYRLDGAGKPHQGNDHYLVFFEVPLVAEDAVELLLRETSPKAEDGGGSYGGRKSPHRTWAVDKPPYEGKKSPYIAGEKIPTLTSTRTITSTLTNVDSSNSKEGTGKLRDHPEVKTLTKEERELKESLAFEVGDALHRMAGNGTVDSHKSAGFHRRLCLLMPEGLVREALTATRDAVERSRGGESRLFRGPAAYFAGAAKKLADANGIELGLKNPGPAPERPQERTRPAMAAPEGN